MPKGKINKIFFLLSLFFLFLIPHLVFALEINYPRVPGTTPPQDFIQTAPPEQILSLYVLYIFNLAIWLSGIIAFAVLIYAGIRYLISAGKPEVIISARDQISSAFLGILVLLSSYLVLGSLNTQLLVLEMPELEPIKIIERPETPQSPTESRQSSISTEVPFAAVIERIFETKVPEEDKGKRKPRMTRIRENSQDTLDIVTALRNSNENLSNIVHLGCGCSAADPVCNGCDSCRSCTCDPCRYVRGIIESIEKKENLPNIEKLRIEQQKTTEEIRLLNIELDRLEKAKKFMLDCPLTYFISLTEFLNTKKSFLLNKSLLLDVKFLEDIKTVEDWANIYCPVSGTIWEREPYFPTEEPAEEPPSPNIPEEEIKPMACTIEAVVGEIIDRAKRTTGLLVKRMEKLLEKDKEMTEAVDKMQVLVSQCSSQIPRCHSVCFELDRVCFKSCAGIACPFSEIKQQAQKIAQIQQEIERLVTAGKPEIGIIPIIEQIVPKILEDLAKEVRRPMKECSYEVYEAVPVELPPVSLVDCETAIESVGPKGKTIQNCCLKEPAFEQCLNGCYLEEGQEKYKKCLNDCLIEKSKELKAAGKIRESEIIATCRHKINFYCCLTI